MPKRSRPARKLAQAALSSEYRQHLQQAGRWLLEVVVSLGGSLSARSSPPVVDRWLERAVKHAYSMGEKRYWVVLGVLSVQRSMRMAGPLLKGTWTLLRGWRRLEPIRTRIPMAHHVLRALLLTALARGFSFRGALRAEFWSLFVGSWLAFSALLRPGEVDSLMVGDLCFPEGAELGEGVSLVVGIRSPKTRRVWKRQFALVPKSYRP